MMVESGVRVRADPWPTYSILKLDDCSFWIVAHTYNQRTDFLHPQPRAAPDPADAMRATTAALSVYVRWQLWAVRVTLQSSLPALRCHWRLLQHWLRLP